MPCTFLSVMDLTVVNTAMPHMMGSFGQTLSDIAWIGTAYSIAEIIMITMTDWWSAFLGRKRLLLGSVVLFALSSILCAQAHSFGALIFFRVLQGLGGGSLIPTAQAVLRETFPPKEHGLAMGIYGVGVVVAPAIGPILGGWLTDSYSWRWAFLINPPIAACALFMIIFFIPEPDHLKRDIERIDWAGIGLLAIGMAALQIVLERGQEKNWLASSQIKIGLFTAVIALVALVFWEMRVRDPIINLRLFRNSSLSAGSVIVFVAMIAFNGAAFLLPIWLQNLMGYTAYESGVALLPRALVMFLLMPAAGWLYNHVNAKALITGGCLILAAACWRLAHLPPNFAFWNLVPIMLMMGCAMPFMFVTLSTVALSGVDKKDLTAAAGLFTLCRSVARNVGYAIMATVIDRRSQFHRARLVDDVTRSNLAFVAARAELARRLISAGVSMPLARLKAMAILNADLNRQALFMSYSDSAWILAVFLIAAVPLAMMLPSRRKID